MGAIACSKFRSDLKSLACPSTPNAFHSRATKSDLERPQYGPRLTSRPRIDLHGHPSIAGRFSVALGAPSSLAAWRCCGMDASEGHQPAEYVLLPAGRPRAILHSRRPRQRRRAAAYFAPYATATLAPSKGRLMRCTVDGLTPNRSAMTRMPGGRRGTLCLHVAAMGSDAVIRSCSPG